MKLAILTCITFVVGVSGSNVNNVDKILLFDEVDLVNNTGVTPITGFRGYPAYSFAKDSEPLIANASAALLFGTKASLLEHFTVSTYIKTSATEHKPILSFSIGRTTIAFDIQFRWNKNDKIVQIRVSLLDGASNQQQYPIDVNVDPTTRDEWLFVSVRIHLDEKLVRVRVNEKYFGHKALNPNLKKFPSNGTLRVAQELVKIDEFSDQINRFVGDLQNLTISFEADCDQSTSFPITVPTTQAPTTQASTTQGITCPTQKVRKTCLGENGKEYANGGEWDENPCVKCVCKSGNSRCVQFCKVCTHEEKFRIDGTSWIDSSCNKCYCAGGTVSCEGTIRVKKTKGCERKCSDPATGSCPHDTYDGCFCPGDKVVVGGKCVDRLACPCSYKGKIYQSGDVLPFVDCNWCECIKGDLSCTKIC